MQLFNHMLSRSRRWWNGQSATATIQRAPGEIKITDHHVFGSPESRRNFIERVFTIPEFSSVHLDKTSAKLRFQPKGCNEASLLARTADALKAPGGFQSQASLQRILETLDDGLIGIYRYGDLFTTWELMIDQPGCIQMRNQGLDSRFAVRTRLEATRGVRQVTSTNRRSVNVLFDPELVDTRQLLEVADAAERYAENSYAENSYAENSYAENSYAENSYAENSYAENSYAENVRRKSPGSVTRGRGRVRHPPARVHGLRRILYLGLAAGSFGMSIVGVILPGIPTVPFLLLTSYYLIRSSPALNERLLRSRLFGQMLRDWNEHRAMRPESKQSRWDSCWSLSRQHSCSPN